jgi:hypothetical protein
VYLGFSACEIPLQGFIVYFDGKEIQIMAGMEINIVG